MESKTVSKKSKSANSVNKPSASNTIAQVANPDAEFVGLSAMPGLKKSKLERALAHGEKIYKPFSEDFGLILRSLYHDLSQTREANKNDYNYVRKLIAPKTAKGEKLSFAVSRENADALMKAAGADISGAYLGNIIDAFLNSLISQLVKLPISVAGKAVGLEDPSLDTKVARNEVASMGKTIVGQALKPAMSSFGGHARTVKGSEEYKKIPRSVRRPYKRLIKHLAALQIDNLKTAQRSDETFPAKTAEEIIEILREKHDAVMQAHAEYKNANHAKRQKYVATANIAANFVIEAIVRNLGTTFLASVDLSLLAPLITLATRSLNSVIMTSISNFYESRSIAWAAILEYEKCFKETNRNVTDDQLLEISKFIQDHIQSKALANFHRRNENIFQPELQRQLRVISETESEIKILKEKHAALSAREYSSILKKEDLLKKYNAQLKNEGEKYAEDDLAGVNVLVGWWNALAAEHVVLNGKDIDRMLTEVLDSIVGVMALPGSLSDEPLSNLENAYKKISDGQDFYEKINELSQSESDKLELRRNLTNKQFSDFDSRARVFDEHEKHFLNAFYTLQILREIQELQENIERESAAVSQKKSTEQIVFYEFQSKVQREFQSKITSKVDELKSLYLKKSLLERDINNYLSRSSDISSHTIVRRAIENDDWGIASLLKNNISGLPERVVDKYVGRSSKPFHESLISKLFAPRITSPLLVTSDVILDARKHSQQRTTDDFSLESFMQSLPSIYESASDPGPGQAQVLQDSQVNGEPSNSISPTLDKEYSPTPAPRKDLSRHRRSAPSADASCRIIDPAELDLIEKGFDQLDQYKKKGGWGEYEVRYVHPTDSSGNRKVELIHSASGLQVQINVSSAQQEEMPHLREVADYYAEETARQIADPAFQDVARTSLGLPESAELKAITRSADELSIRYYDPVSLGEKTMKMSLNDLGLRVAKHMAQGNASTQASAKGASRLGQFMSFISLVTEGYPQDVQSGIGYALNMVDTLEAADRVARQLAVWLEKLPFSKTVGTLIKVGTHELLTKLNKAAPILVVVDVALGIKSIIDLSREYSTATAPRQKAIATDLFFAVTGTVGGVVVGGMGLAGLSATGPAGLALAIVGALGMGISYLVNHTAQTEEKTINVSKKGIQLLKDLQTPMNVKRERGHTTITLHRPGRVRIEGNRAIFTPDVGSVKIQRVKPVDNYQLNRVPQTITEMVDCGFEDIETFMGDQEVSMDIPLTGSLTILQASKKLKITPVYSKWNFESRKYPEITELDNLLNTIKGNKPRRVFETTFRTANPRVLTSFNVEYETAAPSRISSDRPYTQVTTDNQNGVPSFNIQARSDGVATAIPPQSTLNITSAGGAVSIFLPNAIDGKHVVSAGAPEFKKLPDGKMQVKRTMKVREKSKEQIQEDKLVLENKNINFDYSNGIERCRNSWVARQALREILMRYLAWSKEILPSAAFVRALQQMIDTIGVEVVDAKLLEEINKVPKGQQLTKSQGVRYRLYQQSISPNTGKDYHYRARVSLETVEGLLQAELEAIIQHGAERDGVDETLTSEIAFNPAEDFTFSVNEVLSDSIKTHLFNVKKDGTFSQGDTYTSAKPIAQESAPALPTGVDESLYDGGQNIGTLEEPEYVYQHQSGAFYKVGTTAAGDPQMELVETQRVNTKRATRGLLRDLSAFLKWAKAQPGDLRYYQRAHFDGPAITVEPDGYVATHYAHLLRPGPNGTKTIFLHQIPSALTGFFVPKLPTQGKKIISLSADQHRANTAALEAKMNRLLSYRNGRTAGATAEIPKDFGKEIVSFDADGVERLSQIVVNSDVGVNPVNGRPFIKVANQFYNFSDTSRAYSDVIKIQTGSRQFFYRPSTKKLILPPSGENRPLVYLGVGADGEDVFGLQDTTSEFSYFTLPALVRDNSMMSHLSRMSTITRAQLKDFGILDPVAGPQWITGRGGARIRTVITPLGDVYVLEHVNGVTRTRMKGASKWTLGVPKTVTGLESVAFGFDIEQRAGHLKLRAQDGKNAQFVGLKTDQRSPMTIEGGRVLLEHDFNRSLTFTLNATQPNVLELDWSKWKYSQEESAKLKDTVVLKNASGEKLVIQFATGATLSIRDIGDEDFELAARPYTSAQALIDRLTTSTPDVAIGTSNRGELYWDPVRKTLVTQKDGITTGLGSLSAPIRYLDADGTQVGIYADAPGNNVDLPALGMNTYEVGLGKGNTLTLSRSFVENARPRSGGETFVYPNLETLATGEHALMKLDPSQWPNLGDEIEQTDGSVTVTSKGVPAVVLRFIPPKGKRIQLSLLEGTSDTWKVRVVDEPSMEIQQPARQRFAPSQSTWDTPRKNRGRRDVCMLLPVSLLRRLMRRDNVTGDAGNSASRVESVMQSNLDNAQNLRIADMPGSSSLSQSRSSSEAAPSQASTPQRSGGQGLVGRLLTKWRRGESSSTANNAVNPILQKLVIGSAADWLNVKESGVRGSGSLASDGVETMGGNSLYLPFTPNAINSVVTSGQNVFSYKFTGCIMAVFDYQGSRRVAHISTGAGQDCKPAWREIKAQSTNVVEYRPSDYIETGGHALVGCYGLITSEGKAYAITVVSKNGKKVIASVKEMVPLATEPNLSATVPGKVKHGNLALDSSIRGAASHITPSAEPSAGSKNTNPAQQVGATSGTASLPNSFHAARDLLHGNRVDEQSFNERAGASRVNQVKAAVQQLDLDRPLTPEEQRVVDGGFVTKKHLLAIAEAAHSGNFHASFRNTGKDALSWIEKGAATKPHSILEKTLKSDRVPPHLRLAVQNSGLLGLAAHWENGEPVGVFVTREAALGWQEKGGPRTLSDDHGNFYVPINFSIENDSNLAALKAVPDWERTVITGDYDMHDNIVRGGAGGAHTAVSDSPQELFIKNVLNAAISGADPTRVGSEHLMIQHGPQVNYPAHVMNHESARNQLVPAVARPSFPLAFVDNERRWTIVNTQAELQTYYASRNIRIKETWKEGGVSQFVETGSGTVGIGRSAQSPSQRVTTQESATPTRTDGGRNAGNMRERYSANTVKTDGDGRQTGHSQSESKNSEVLEMTVQAEDFVLNKNVERVDVPEGLAQSIRMGSESKTARTDIYFSASGRAVIDPNLTGDLVVNFTNSRKQVVEVDPAMLTGMIMIEDGTLPGYLGFTSTRNGKSLRILIPKNSAKGAIHVKGQAAPFIFHSEREFKVGLSRGFRPLPSVGNFKNLQWINGHLGFPMSGRGVVGDNISPTHPVMASSSPIQNFNLNQADNLASMARPTNTNLTATEFADNLKAQGVKAVISLDRRMMDNGEDAGYKTAMEAVRIRYTSEEAYFIEDFFTAGESSQPSIAQIDKTVQRIDELQARYPQGIIAVHCGAGDGRSGTVKSAFIMKKFLESNADVYREDHEAADVTRTKYDEEDAKHTSSYRLVRDAIDYIRMSHPHAVERPDDVMLLNKYAEFLMNKSTSRQVLRRHPLKRQHAPLLKGDGDALSQTDRVGSSIERQESGSVMPQTSSNSDVVSHKQNIGNLIRYSVQQANANGTASKTAVFSAHGIYYHSNVGIPAPDNLNTQFLVPHGNFLSDPTVDFLVNSQGKWSSFVDVKGNIVNHNDLRRPDLNMDHQPDRSTEQSLGTSENGKIRDYQYYHYENDPNDAEIFRILKTNLDSVTTGQKIKMDLLTLSSTVQDPRIDSDVSFSLADLMEMHNTGQLVNSDGLPYETLIMSHCRSFAGYPEDPTYTYHSNPILNDFLKGQASAGNKIEQLIQSTITFGAQGSAPIIRETVLGFIVRPARSRVGSSTSNDETEPRASKSF